MKNRVARHILPLLAAVSLAGCGAAQASNRDTIPRGNITQCRSLCESSGMALQSIVIVANQTGCVCGVQGSLAAASAASGGAVAVMLAEEEQRRQEQQQ